MPRSKTTSTCVKQSTCDLVNAKGSCLAMKHSNDEVCTIVYEFEYGPLPPNSKHFVSTSCMYSLIPRPSASSTCIIPYTSYNRNAQVNIPFSLPSTTSRTLSAWHFGSRMALCLYMQNSQPSSSLICSSVALSTIHGKPKRSKNGEGMETLIT